jgi:hypothetical protein
VFPVIIHGFCLHWLTTGKTVGDTKLYDESNILSREKALELYTRGSAWFSNEIEKKGAFLENQLADFAVLSKNFFQVQDDEIKDIYSVMTVVGGKIVHASDEFSELNPPLPKVSPDWSPIQYYGTYAKNKTIISSLQLTQHARHHHHSQMDFRCFCWAF